MFIIQAWQRSLCDLIGFCAQIDRNHDSKQFKFRTMACKVRILNSTQPKIDQPTTTIFREPLLLARWQPVGVLDLGSDIGHHKGHKGRGQTTTLTHSSDIKRNSYELRLQAFEFSASYSNHPCYQNLVTQNHKPGVRQASPCLFKPHHFGVNSPRASTTSLCLAHNKQLVRDCGKVVGCKLDGMFPKDFARYCQNRRLPRFHLVDNTNGAFIFLGMDESANAASHLRVVRTSLVCGRMAKYSPFKPHWMRLSRAVLLVKAELHLVFECMTLCLDSAHL